MNLGNWDNSIIKSILYVGILIPLYYLISSNSINDVSGLLVTFLLFIGVYFVISFLGWLIIGFPIHWIICRFTNKHAGYYALVAFIVGLLFYSAGFVFSFAVVIQIFIFRLYVFKKT
nr:hypothetical protein BCU55_19480 [Shewanella sp. 10N.286.48.A6]